MKIRTFLAIGLLISATGVVYGAQAEDDDPFGLADFNDEMDVLCAQVAEAEIAAEKAIVLAEQAALVRPQLSAEEQNSLNRELLQTAHEGRKDAVARVQDLIARGADVAFRDELDWISLHCAVCGKIIPEVVAVLVEANPGSVNYQTNRGSTPLHLVVWDRSYERIIKALLGAGADPDIPDSRGETPRQLAEKNGLGHLLQERGAKTKPAVKPQVLRK